MDYSVENSFVAGGIVLLCLGVIGMTINQTVECVVNARVAEEAARAGLVEQPVLGQKGSVWVKPEHYVPYRIDVRND